ncbi:MAG TPA: hypothetical protein VKL21_04365 [Candidatus Methanoperedens sp.]|nr:hypothetical protein [Candidatus Methanoperedens sp.]
MDELMEKIQKLQSDYFKRRRLLLILDLISIFAIFYAIFIILSAGFFLDKFFNDPRIPTNIILPIIALIIAIIGAFLLHKNDHKIKFNFLVEGKYPELKEKLRTAYDNISESNVIVDSLKSLVLDGLAIVSSSRLIQGSVIVTKIILVIIFISTATFISLNSDKYSIPPDTIANNFKNLTGIGNTDTNGTIDITGSLQNMENVAQNGSGNIFGKPKIASIEGKNIDLTLYSGQDTGFEVRDTSQASNQFIKSAAFPVDVLGSNVSDGGYSMLMKKTESEKQLINKYAVERSKI